MVKVFATILILLTICCIITRGQLIRPTNTLRKITLTDPEFNYPVTVYWGQGADTMNYWNEICAASIEMFGLPGDRFITDISAEAMTWSFRSDKDALLFKLKFSEVAC